MNQPICNYWIDTAAIKDGTLGNMDKGECLEIINSSGKGINLEKPFKFAKAEQKHMSNIIRRFFKSSIEGELPWEKYSLTDSEWTFNNEWLCNNSREENENIEVVSCQKLGQEELKKKFS
ncbi:hypothetical protein MSU_0221 [Mycoplasma suis str. Illinois]|uniref:Uncharacterized protein n=2 Tax=Mycoplasma suis TaxID=57372 RepID=F0QQJ5_MYCSL|nr:hypothetical protein MSU_0221 [Mycoplasma suis str. Illinois]